MEMSSKMLYPLAKDGKSRIPKRNPKSAQKPVLKQSKSPPRFLNMVLNRGEATLVLGAQFGDEGKGKIIDVLSESADLVCRMQGGNNAGHTIWVGSQKVVTHLLPSGILRERCQVAIGAGVVIDLAVLKKEIESVIALGYDVTPQRLLIDPRAHIILPYHKQLDGSRESTSQKAIGTTGRGIGPTYASRAYREGPRLGDLCSEQSWNRVRINSPTLFENINAEVLQELEELGKFFKPFLKDVAMVASNRMLEKKAVMLEGAQGAMLDIAFGTYPYVTSSSLIAGSCAGGLGIPPWKVKNVCGVFKAYVTRVGNGPFPGELFGELADRLRTKGNEFGSTTGRPRRIGWLDLVQLRYLTRLNGYTSLALMKSDVLSDFEYIGVIVGYRDARTGEVMEGYPATLEAFEAVQPVLEFVESWTYINDEEGNLHQNVQTFVEKIEQFVQCPVVYVSSGPARDQGIWLSESL